jgi:hypothetical protein
LKFKKISQLKNKKVLFFLALISSNVSAQKITYSSPQKYHKIRLGVKYPVIAKTNEISKETEKIAVVSTPFLDSKKKVHGAIIYAKK